MYRWAFEGRGRRFALFGLIWRTGTFTSVTWLGQPIWQNPLDAWALQETIIEDGIDLVVECGTNRGGSAYFVATLFDLLNRGHVITIDVEDLAEVEHPRIDFVIGSSVEPAVVERVKARVAELGSTRTLVLLDSDHAGEHVLRELELYGELVPVGGFIFAQDGCIDELRLMRSGRPGPLWAIRRFVRADPRFEIDEERSNRYLYTASPSGWLRRVS
jgi:cephalosporin hydroxylase